MKIEALGYQGLCVINQRLSNLVLCQNRLEGLLKQTTGSDANNFPDDAQTTGLGTTVLEPWLSMMLFMWLVNYMATMFLWLFLQSFSDLKVQGECEEEKYLTTEDFNESLLFLLDNFASLLLLIDIILPAIIRLFICWMETLPFKQKF